MGTFEVGVVSISSLKKHPTGAIFPLGSIWFGLLHRFEHPYGPGGISGPGKK